jgi:allantoin racemase
MRIGIINPTTTAAFGHKNLAAGRRVAGPGTEIVSFTPLGGPPSIEGHLDEVAATVAILETIRDHEADGIDGWVIACFGDPGIWAAREVARGPVIGIAEAAFHAATMVATHFSVVTTLQRTVVIAEHLLQIFGFSHRCRRVRASELEVLALEDAGSAAYATIRDECRSALSEDASDAIVLGCAGMADLAARLESELNVPVVEGVAAGVALIEGLVRQGLTTSKRGDLAFPLPKTYRGRLADLSPTVPAS